MPWFFAHGSNIHPKLMRRRFGAWQEARRAVLHDYDLVFVGARNNDLVQRHGEKVFGVAYLLSDLQLLRITRWKKEQWGTRPRVTDFLPIQVTVEDPNGLRLRAVTQALRRRRPRAHPEPYYLAMILDGLRQHGWGSEALEAWRAAAAKT